MADVKLNIDQWKKFAEAVAKSTDQKRIDEAKSNALRQMAAAYLRAAIKKTPKGLGGTVKIGGEKKRLKKVDKDKTWKAGEVDERYVSIGEGEKERVIRVNSEHMQRSWDAGKIEKTSRAHRIAITNSASYASFVNDGHRQTPGRFVPILGKRLVANFVEGQHMAEKAQAYTESKAGGIIRRQTSELLKGLKNGGK